MGWLCSRITFSVSCLMLVWAAGAGSVKVLHEPTCFSDYISISTCEWKMDGPTNCSAELRLTYLLNSEDSENLTCVPENKEGTVCVCYMPIDDVAREDIYQLSLWAGRQLLWNGSFKPSENVKPLAPRNLTVRPNVSEWLLTWSDPYPHENYLYSQLNYQINISNENDPTDVILYDVTYEGCSLYFQASILKPGAFYSARVKCLAREYKSSWSDWSPSTRWHNYFQPPMEQHLPLGVSISCIIIVVLCLSCYVSILKIKKEWWDQIPNPARSPMVTIVIQDTQVSLWGKRSRGQEPIKCPHWKSCLTKLLPCFLEHGMGTGEDAPKAARNGPLQGPGISPLRPVEVSKTILWPESISVVRCVELSEAPEEREEEVEGDKRSFCPSSHNSGGSFLEGREGIAARLTENLFLDLLGGEDGDFHPQGLEGSCLPPSSGTVSAQMLWTGVPREGPQETCQSEGPESDLWAARPQRPASPTFTEMPTVVTDNPAYRSFSPFPSPPSGPGVPNPDPQPSECRGGVGHGTRSAQQPSEPLLTLHPEPETWEQILRQSVLQHRMAAAPAPLSDYREFLRAVEQGGTQDGQGAGCGPTRETGYKAFSSLLASSATCPGTSGEEGSSGDSSYKPLQSLAPGCPEASAPVSRPLLTFGLDMEPPHSPQHSLPPGSYPECTQLEPVDKGEDRQKPLCALEQATDPLQDDLGSGIIYSALTCHLCGHLKQCHSQDEQGDTHVVATPCCGCCCGDRSSPPVSPLRTLDFLPSGVPLEASFSSDSLAPLGVSEEAKPSLLCQPAPGNAQSSSQTPKMVAVLSTRPACMTTS
ncbi:interleukin-4 receptor subunit alpha [Talpa occidentalis]|uniref:interleukin-4 receptor subunit alpha n=1 Tax=Talpa occidentalis TaxID=50954 RepID=UPI00188F0090|nr:interleukin-4 receptor subunit alpha [Talpa occidentalis]XP_037363287.1 interleukin-4 receptor subunit alpha [Talpa occidentalis]XP_037363288.1 interleukin-4 receptor subunit alpha [Talpa occidentalis]